ncbi:hypothetical protein Trydic_g21188 [Trypoxylus dichotomus]
MDDGVGRNHYVDQMRSIEVQPSKDVMMDLDGREETGRDQDISEEVNSVIWVRETFIPPPTAVGEDSNNQ